MWIAAELPDIPPACIAQAAEHYSIPTALLVAVGKVENGEVGRAYERSHGTYYSKWQISDKWLPVLAPWGYTASVLQNDACANANSAAYVLAYYRLREPNWTNAIARYNVGSLNTPGRVEAGTRYVEKVLRHWWRIYEQWSTAVPRN